MSKKIKQQPKTFTNQPAPYRYLADEAQGFYVMLPSEFMAQMSYDLGYKVERRIGQTNTWEEYRG